MNIPLKTILIFCLVAATTAQSTTDVPSSSTAKSTDTPSGTTNDITVPTEAPKETSTGTFTTDTKTDSTDNTPASITTATTTVTTTTTTTQGACASNPCIGNIICEERFGGFACICQPGLVYLEMRGCIQTKVFPGNLTVARDFKKNMADKISEEFQKTAGDIENALRKTLVNDTGYINSTVLKLSEGSVIAEVQNFYDLSSDATSASVEDKIEKSIKVYLPEGATYTRGSMCEIGICDNNTTETCEEQDNSGTVRCTCKEGYIRSQFTSLLCIPCPNGEMAVDEDNCEKCSFGFSGFNCSEPYLLVVIVVSTVLGALLIIFIVALIVVSCRNQKGSSSSQEDFSSNYGNKELHKPTGVPRIPRANPDANWKSNNLEMTNSGSNQALVTRDRPESNARYTGYYEDVSYRSHVPPAHSGYGGRGEENGGVHNPYFRQDDDSMRRY
ncbi:hypothetical protein cypCar_00040723 [Cyprinus carpio]|uniref:Mucin 13b, cell surface associated n=1 Tax=Cyprinus carpio carpio TaxID=630221 RepID=A0A8C1F1P7_CYPCA|nr:hypothetical protein cypCar_00040723 [Cyprinus carpio]